MTNSKIKRSNNPSRPQGRQNAFSSKKLAFLESYKDQFLELMDHGPFYTMVAITFLQKFGYFKENPAVDNENVDAAGEDNPALQSPEKQQRDGKCCNKIYCELQDVSK